MFGLFNTGAKVKITLTDGNGNYITSWVAKGGDTLKLGDDHSVYRIYVDYYHDANISKYDWVSGAKDFENTGNAYTWKISNAKDCSIS